MKIAYFGYDFFYTCLETLLEAGHEVIKIFTYETDDTYNFNEFVKAVSERNNIPIQFHHVTPDDIHKLYEQGCELIVSAAYPFKIPVLPDTPLKGINIHPTLLPEGRGPWPLPHIILKGLEQSGVTIHKLSENFDSGDILAQFSFSISPSENLESLSCKTQLCAASLLTTVMNDFDTHWQHSTPQGLGSYWPFPSEKEKTLDWNQSVEDIHRTVRAIGKFESMATFGGKDWTIQDATVWKENHDHQPGTIVHRTNKEVVIAAKDGLVCLRFFAEDTKDTL